MNLDYRADEVASILDACLDSEDDIIEEKHYPSLREIARNPSWFQQEPIVNVIMKSIEKLGMTVIEILGETIRHLPISVDITNLIAAKLEALTDDVPLEFLEGIEASTRWTREESLRREFRETYESDIHTFFRYLGPMDEITTTDEIRRALLIQAPKIAEIIQRTQYNPVANGIPLIDFIEVLVPIKYLINNTEIKSALLEKIDWFEYFLYESTECYLILGKIVNIPYLMSSPRLQVVVASMFRQPTCEKRNKFSYFHKLLLMIVDNPFLMENTLVRHAISLNGIRVTYDLTQYKREEEIRSLVTVLKNTKLPWRVISELQEVPRLAQEIQLVNAMENRVDDIAEKLLSEQDIDWFVADVVWNDYLLSKDQILQSLEVIVRKYLEDDFPDCMEFGDDGMDSISELWAVEDWVKRILMKLREKEGI